MFDLKLIEIFSTVGIGIITAVLLIYLYFLFNKLFVNHKYNDEIFRSWINDRLKEDYKTSYAVIFGIFIYCLGIISSTLTDHMTDTDDTYKNFAIKELKWVSSMPTEGELRFNSLLDDDTTTTSLGKSIFRTKEITKNANRISATSFFTDSAVINNNDSLKIYLLKYSKDRRNFRSFINSIYYTSKNWCYSKDSENLNDLKSLQNQIDFSRSIVLLIAFTAQVIILMFLSFLVFALYKKPDVKNWVPYKEILVLTVIFFVCRECYKICEINFDKRAYGNYASYVQEIPVEKSSKSITHYININCSKDSVREKDVR